MLVPRLCSLALGLGLILAANSLPAAESAKPPAVGEAAPDFTLTALDEEQVKLSALTRQGPVVLIVLRGYPGYQCPACTLQVGEFLSRARQFAADKASVVFVYPGQAKGLTERAQEFARGKTLPENIYLVTDPDYGFTLEYGLRWDKPGETAYPSTFVIDSTGKVRFAHMSKTHGDRAKATAVLAELKKL